MLFEARPMTEVQPGNYTGVVREVSRDTIVPRQGRNAGKDVDVTRWTWYLEEAEEDVESLTGIDPTSEKSNLFGYLVALVGPDRESWLGLTPENLVGRKAMVNVIIQDGYPKVTAVTPLPKVKGKPVSPVVAPAATPVAPSATVSPLREAEEPDAPDDLPF